MPARKILVVDDDDVLRDSLVEQIESESADSLSVALARAVPPSGTRAVTFAVSMLSIAIETVYSPGGIAAKL